MQVDVTTTEIPDRITSIDQLKEIAGKVNPGGVDLYELAKKPVQQSNIPSKTDPAIQQSFDKNRLEDRSRGPYQAAVYQERIALRDLLRRGRVQLNAMGSNEITLSDKEILDLTKYIPNSRFTYYNRLIKNAIKSGKTSTCDINFVDSIWMNEEAKTALKRLLIKFFDPELEGYTVDPTQSKSGLPIQCVGKALKFNLYNPGLMDYPTPCCNSCKSGEVCESKPQQLMQSAKHIDVKLLARTVAENLTNALNMDNQESESYEFLDNSVAKLLNKLYSYLKNGCKVQQLRNLLIQLTSDMASVKKNDYLISLLCPFLRMDHKVPKRIQQYTSSISISTIVTIYSNALGNAAVVFQPFYMAPLAGLGTTFFVNNHATLTGTASNNNFLGVNIGQTPAVAYNMYSLVSFGARFRPLGSLNTTKGFSVLSMQYDPDIAAANAGIASASAQQYGQFNLIDNGYYRQTIQNIVGCRDTSFLFARYCPMGDDWATFLPIGTAKNGLAYTWYCTGAAASEAVCQVEIVVNYECTAGAAITDWVPATQTTLKYSQLQETYDILKSYPPIQTGEIFQEDIQASRSDGWLRKKYADNDDVVEKFAELNIKSYSDPIEDHAQKAQLTQQIETVIQQQLAK
jgi:hypothetical protein